MPMVVSLWIGPVTKMEKLCVQSFIQNGFEFDLYTYDSIPGLVQALAPVTGKGGGSLVVLDARAVLPDTDVFESPRVDGTPGGLTAFSNIWRYKYLVENGGMWVDMDMVCAQSFLESPFPFVPLESETDPGLCVMNSPRAGDPFFKALLDTAQRRVQQPSYRFGDSGPKLVKDLLNSYPYVQRTSPHLFCALPCKDFANVTKSGFELDAGAAVHLWREMWVTAKLDRDGTYPGDSLYERWKRQYGVA